MPGLVRGVARTAVVAGTATATANAVNRHQAKKNAAAYSQAYDEVAQENVQPVATPQGAAPVTTAQPATPTDTTADELTQLAALKDQGIITEEEFAAKKKQILGL